MSKDEWRLLSYGLLAPFLMGATLGPIYAHNIQLRRMVACAICGAIAGAVFLLSEYMKRRKDQTEPMTKKK